MKDSCTNLQASEKDGKYPYLFSCENLETPSTLNVDVNTYLFMKV